MNVEFYFWAGAVLQGCQVTTEEALEMPTVAADGSSETDVCVSAMVLEAE